MHKKTPNGTNEAVFIEQENPFGGGGGGAFARHGSGAVQQPSFADCSGSWSGASGGLAWSRRGRAKEGGKSMHQAILSTLPNCARAALLCKLAEAFEERILRFRKFAGRGGRGAPPLAFL